MVAVEGRLAVSRRVFGWASRSTLILGGLLLLATMFLSVEISGSGSRTAKWDWHRPIDDVAKLANSIADWWSPSTAMQTAPVATSRRRWQPPPPPAPRELLLAYASRLIGLWVPIAIMGVAAVLVALR